MDIKELDIFSKSNRTIRHPWETARMKVIQRLLLPILDTESPKGAVLDIGCGDAYVIQHLVRRWPELDYLGVDSAIHDDVIKAFENVSDFSKKVSFYSDLSDIQETADIYVVLLLDVLEHVNDDRALLIDAAGRLKKNGYVLITVPAFQRLYCQHDEWLGHFRRYSKSRLSQCVREAGLNPLMCGYFFSALLFPRTVHKLLELTRLMKRSRTPTGIGEWKYGRFVGSLINNLLYWNGCLDITLSKTGLAVPGLSIFLLCQK